MLNQVAHVSHQVTVGKGQSLDAAESAHRQAIASAWVIRNGTMAPAGEPSYYTTNNADLWVAFSRDNAGAKLLSGRIVPGSPIGAALAAMSDPQGAVIFYSYKPHVVGLAHGAQVALQG